MKHRLITSLLVTAIAAAGCVSNRMYRETSVVEHPGYTLAFIEFDDRGEVWSPRQFTELQALIRRANETETGAVVLLFVHGWNHNASPRNEENGALAGFKQTLERLQQTVDAMVPGKPVIGIYLGWRGQSLRGPLKFLTFFTRQRAAARVAGTSAAAILGQIILDTKQNPTSRLIVIGHSFGGQIVERVFQNAVASTVLRVEEGEMHASADLTVLINPASPATNAKQVIDLLRWRMLDLERVTEDGRRWKAPIIVSLTSEGDSATRGGYRVGNLFGLLTSRFRDYGPEFCSPLTSQRSFYTRTAGHTPVLHSHQVRTKPIPPDAAPFTATDDGFDIAGHDVLIEVNRRSGAYNDTPYWIMRVPTTVIADHNDTWNPNLRALVGGLLSATGALEPSAKLMVVKNEGMDPVLLWPRVSGSLWLVDRSRRIFGVADAHSSPTLVGCVPEGVDLANVIGHAGDSTTLFVVQWRANPRDPEERNTEIVEINLVPGGFRRVAETALRSEEHFLHAVVDRPRGRVFLATAEKLFVAEYGGRSARPEVVRPLHLSGTPSAVAFDQDRHSLLIHDDGNGCILHYDLQSPILEPQTLVHDLDSPSAMAVDPVQGHIYAVDRLARAVIRWQRIDDHCGHPEVVALHDGFHDPTFLEITEDGSIWVGDPEAGKIFRFSDDGELIQVLE